VIRCIALRTEWNWFQNRRRPPGRNVGTAIDGFDHADRFEGLFAGAAELIVAAGRIHRFEDARRCLVARLELLEVADGDCGLRSAPRF